MLFWGRINSIGKTGLRACTMTGTETWLTGGGRKIMLLLKEEKKRVKDYESKKK